MRYKSILLMYFLAVIIFITFFYRQIKVKENPTLLYSVLINPNSQLAHDFPETHRTPTPVATPTVTSTPAPPEKLSVFLPITMRDYCEINYFMNYIEEEPNNSWDQANGNLMIGDVYQGYPNDLKDYFSFYLCQTEDIKISLSNYLVGKGQLQLFYQSISNLVSYDYKAGPERMINYPSAPPGKYFVYIATTEGFNDSSQYFLVISKQ